MPGPGRKRRRIPWPAWPGPVISTMAASGSRSTSRRSSSGPATICRVAPRSPSGPRTPTRLTASPNSAPMRISTRRPAWPGCAESRSTRSMSRPTRAPPPSCRRRCRPRLPPGGMTVALDHLQTSYAAEQQGGAQAGVPVQNDPPRIVFAAAPTVLVQIDGDPVLQPVAGAAGFQRVVNSRVLILQDGSGFHVKAAGSWYQAPGLDGSWVVITAPSAALRAAATAAAKSAAPDLAAAGWRQASPATPLCPGDRDPADRAGADRRAAAAGTGHGRRPADHDQRRPRRLRRSRRQCDLPAGLRPLVQGRGDGRSLELQSRRMAPSRRISPRFRRTIRKADVLVSVAGHAAAGEGGDDRGHHPAQTATVDRSKASLRVSSCRRCSGFPGRSAVRRCSMRCQHRGAGDPGRSGRTTTPCPRGSGSSPPWRPARGAWPMRCRLRSTPSPRRRRCITSPTSGSIRRRRRRWWSATPRAISASSSARPDGGLRHRLQLSRLCLRRCLVRLPRDQLLRRRLQHES